jgi:hypothetical protein
MNKDKNKNIKYYCDVCHQIPSSHSFEVVCHVPRIDNIKEIIFYTKVANAIKYDDTEGILNHYENLLRLENPDQWIWIFDCDHFGLKHSLELKTAKRIANLISNFGKVKKILVINSNTFINFVYRAIKGFLDREITKNIIMIKSDQKTKYMNELLHLHLSSEDFNNLMKLMTL